MKYKHFTFCIFFCFVLLFVVLGAASLRPCIFLSPLNPSTRMVLRNFGIRISPSQVTLYQTVCIWLLHFFLLGGNSIASKSPWTNSDLRSSRQLEENTEHKDRSRRKKSSNTLFNIVIVLLSHMVFRQLRFVITTCSNSDFSHAMGSDERRLKLSCCIVRSLINAAIQGFHRDEELMLNARRLFPNHSPC